LPPVAAVVFPKEVRSRTMADNRVKAASKALVQAPDDVSRAQLRAEYEKVHREVFAEKQGEVADYFDSVHNVQRAKDVGSLHEIIPPDCDGPNNSDRSGQQIGASRFGPSRPSCVARVRCPESRRCRASIRLQQ
jgi:hypothetical protein